MSNYIELIEEAADITAILLAMEKRMKEFKAKVEAVSEYDITERKEALRNLDIAIMNIGGAEDSIADARAYIKARIHEDYERDVSGLNGCLRREVEDQYYGYL